MAFAETAPLVALLKLDDKFSGPLKNAQKSLSGFDAKLSQTGTRAFRAGEQIGTGIKNGLKIAAVGVGLLASQVVLGLNSLVKLEQAQAQTAAVIKSTSGAAGIQATTVRKLAEQYEALNATIGDELIQSGENLLLTFTNIQKDAFEPALKTALDMNVALGKGPEGLTDTVRILGKALNDPAKGLTALQRIGIRFTDDQKKQIAAALKANDTFKAQSIILAELNRRFGGSFIGQGGTTGARVAKFTDSIEDLQRALATALLPTVGKVADRLSSFLADPKVIAGVSELGEKIAGLFNDENINTGATILGNLFKIAKDAAPALEKAASVTGQVIGTAVDIFRSLPPEIQALAVAGLAINKLTGGLVTNIAGGLISAVLKQLVSGVVNVNGAVVNVNGIGAGGPGGLLPTAAAAGGGGLLATAGALVVPVSIAAVTVGAAGALANAIDPTATARGTTTLFNRDPRRFNENGQVIRNSIAAVPQAIRLASAKEDRNSLRLEQAIARKKLSVKVNVNNRTSLFLNGRLVEASLSRFATTIGQAVAGAFG